MNQKKIAVNAVLNIIKSGLSIIFPLVTYPYALRILGAENMGKISYSLSLVSYFTLISKFGISSYATREGSKIKDNKEKFSKFVNEIFTLNDKLSGLLRCKAADCFPNTLPYAWIPQNTQIHNHEASNHRQQ